VEAQVPITSGGIRVSGTTGLLDATTGQSSARSLTDLAWKGRIPASKCTWLAGSPDALVGAAARYDIVWDPKRRALRVVVGDWLFLGPDGALEVRWTRDGKTLAVMRSANDPTPLSVPSPDSQPPGLGDRLEFRHQYSGSSGWDVQFSVEL